MPGPPLVATYRLQLHAGFSFRRAREVLGYLEALGVSHLYASPILQARPGSEHGYDITDPTRVSRELGGEGELERLVRELGRRGMGLIADVVPNHLAAATTNPWWADVLESGPRSPHGRLFDIDWRPPRPDLRDRLLVPILGSRYGEELYAGRLRLSLDERGFAVRYYEHRLPVAVETYGAILEAAAARARGRGGRVERELRALAGEVERFAAAAPDLEPGEHAARRRLIKASLREGLRKLPSLGARIARAIGVLNGRRGDPESFVALDGLLARQHYRLAHWKRAGSDINYRRFFNVNDLVSVRLEDPLVFEQRHALLLEHLRRGLLAGVRVDHVDGLQDPEGYLERLRERLGPERCLYVEKILALDEELPGSWPVDGTTGYELLNRVNDLLVEPRGLRALERGFARRTGDSRRFAEVARETRLQVMERHFGAEFAALALDLARLAAEEPASQGLSLEELREALQELTAALGVYRSYGRGTGGLGARDRRLLRRALGEAGLEAPGVSRLAFRFVGQVVLGEGPVAAGSRREGALSFLLRWQQLTGAVMAKGVEDTAFYVHVPLLARNEVGGEPGKEPGGPAAFHRAMRRRRERFPRCLSATSTHDTKRGEDARARLDLLSEMPARFDACLARWHRLGERFTSRVRGFRVPDAREETLLYQSILGAWPAGAGMDEELRERLVAYAWKAAREAKVHTSWIEPSLEHEEALLGFVRAVLTPGPGNRVLPDLERLVRRLAPAGAVNGLAQLVLKLTAPGVPDLYQGSELWDHRLVDPDNRRPVDFTHLRDALGEVREGRAGARSLLGSWRDGRVKLHVIERTVGLRREDPGLFLRGTYEPVAVAGPREAHVVAFLRRRGRRAVLVVVPRLPLTLGVRARPRVPPGVWRGTRLVLPAKAPRRWRDRYLGELREARRRAGGGLDLPVAGLLGGFPVAVLAGEG